MKLNFQLPHIRFAADGFSRDGGRSHKHEGGKTVYRDGGSASNYRSDKDRELIQRLQELDSSSDKGSSRQNEGYSYITYFIV